ncbi:MAG: aminotransferase class I/II-fold pyridoxal phosphate-dependent enzyme [Acidimicrobiales bacterium]
METWHDRVDGELEAIRRVDRWRQPVDFDTDGPVTGTVDGRPMVSFAANDYLGLTWHPAVVAAAREAIDCWGAGSGASRLVVGSRPIHTELEVALARWKGTDDAVLFPTGFAANLGVLAAFGRAGVTVLSDELNHASIIDGCRLARAAVQVYRHCDLDHLASCLEAVDDPALVVTDTVFSMDGDAVDLGALAALAAEYGALLVLDEAHAVLGPELPAGLSAPVVTSTAVGRDRVVGSTGPTGPVPTLRVGTLSKTLGALGGFVAGPQPFVDLLRNVARPYIFTTAPTPADTAAALAALRVVTSAEGEALVGRLRAHVDRLWPGHPSPIVPVVIGSETDAKRAAAALAEHGLLVPAIRPPTVPPGTSRLRVALSAAHEDHQIDALLDGLAEILPSALPGVG